MSEPRNQARKGRLPLLLAGIAVAMFGFGFALVPLYGLFCDAVGANNLARANSSQAADVTAAVDMNREVTVQFDANVRSGLPWEFEPLQRSVTVRPGEQTVVSYRVRNRAGEAVTGQAIPGITPWQATPYLAKLECFCFNNQTLAPGEEKVLELRFFVLPDLPEGLDAMVLSYTFMNTNRESEQKYAAMDSGKASQL